MVTSPGVPVEIGRIAMESEAVAFEVHLHVRVGEVEPNSERAITYPVLTDGRWKSHAFDDAPDARFERRVTGIEGRDAGGDDGPQNAN